MSRVFVVQEPSKRGRNGWEPKYDLSAAEAFGEVVRVLPPGNVPNDRAAVRNSIHRVLTADGAAFDASTDYVLLLGDPVAMAHAVALLAEERANQLWDRDYPIRVLKWDRRDSQYIPYEV